MVGMFRSRHGRPVALVLLLILFIGTGLRFRGIADRSIWFDEAFSWTLVTEFGPTEIVERTGRDVHPPLYYLLLWAWVSVLGDSLIAMRSLSVLLGAAAIYVAWLVGKSITRDRGDELQDTTNQPGTSPPDAIFSRSSVTGLTFAALVATSAFQIRWSGEVRMYSLLSLLMLLSTHFVYRAACHVPAQRRWWVAFSVTSAAMMYTHNYGLFSVCGLSGFALVTVLYRRLRQPDLESRQRLGHCLAAIAGIGLLYLPWLPTLLAQRAQVADDYWIKDFSWRSVAIAWDHLVLIENRYGPDQADRGAIVVAVVVLVCLLLQFRGKASDRLCGWVTLTPVVLAIVISSLGSSIINSRLFVLAHLGALLTGARAIARWTDAPSGALLTLLLVVNGLYIHIDYHSSLQVADHQGVRAAMREVEASARTAPPVIVLQPCVYFSARYHATDRERVKLFTRPENIRHYTGAPILQPGEFQPVEALSKITTKTIWVLSSSGFSAGYTEPFLPAEWVAQDRHSFATPYAFEGNVKLTRYHRVAVDSPSEQNLISFRTHTTP